MKLKKISKLKTGFFSRNFNTSRIMMKLMKDIYFSKEEMGVDKIGKALAGKVEDLTNELGALKGSFLKAGQLLSLYAEDLLPPEVENLFQRLQKETTYLEWEEISKQIPTEIKDRLQIEEDAFASASIGQVHRAQFEQHNLALKIQFKNIDKVIDLDIKILKWLVRLLKIFPQELNLDGMFEEIKTMLRQEMDYEVEKKFTQQFYQLVENDYLVPKVYEEFSNSKVLCTQFIQGEELNSVVPKLNQDQRNKLGREFFLLFLKELFEWGVLQSDSHPGNYLIKDDKWVLLDFGACKVISPRQQKSYFHMIKAIFEQDYDLMKQQLVEDGIIDWNESNEELFKDYFQLLSTPFKQKNYDWGKSDVSKKVMNMGPKLYRDITVKHIPFENIFIDRKIAGLFYILKILQAEGDITPRDYFNNLKF